MFGDESEALEGLRRSEEKLREYATARNLVLREEQPYPGYVPAAQQPGPVKHAIWSLAGTMPGGAVGRLRHQAAFGRTFGVDVRGQHTIMICRIPESVGYVPFLSCRPDEFGGALYHWDNDHRRKAKQRFESIELDRRYVVEAADGQSQSWIFQLFSPTFIDWLAHSTPVDFGFKLDLGVFHCETPQWRGQATALTGEVEPEALDLLLESGGKVASRIRDEVLEEAAILGEPEEADSAAAYATWANAPKHGRIIKTILWASRLGPGDDGIGKFASDRGLKKESPADLPLPLHRARDARRRHGGRDRAPAERRSRGKHRLARVLEPRRHGAGVRSAGDPEHGESRLRLGRPRGRRSPRSGRGDSTCRGRRRRRGRVRDLHLRAGDLRLHEGLRNHPRS